MTSYLIENEEYRPQNAVRELNGRRVMAMDSARYVSSDNTGRDVVVTASYLGVLPARMMAPHRPRAVIGHDACIGKDGAGIAGLFYLEALGIPAAAANGNSAELGNGKDLYESGVISRMNIFAEQCGVKVGMSVQQAADVLLLVDPTDVQPGNKVRRQTVESSSTGRSIVVTDSIVFALAEDRNRNVLVTAGHTGRSGAAFLIEAAPWGFICSDGGKGKNDAGIAGLAITDEAGIPGACSDAQTSAIGDAYSAWDAGIISACNQTAHKRGVRVGQTVKNAARILLQEKV